MKAILSLILALWAIEAAGQPSALDAKVEKFLKEHRGEWHDLNVPYVDGQTLHDIIVKNHYTSALEIGTSTGHSTIWIAWAMSKTGGKVTTVELDDRRRKQALKNLEEAGLSAFVDSRLGNAHEIVKQLPGPFDFVFSDADKNWYKQYFIDVNPKLKKGGCYTTHNILDGQAGDDYLDYVRNNPEYESHIDRFSHAGILVSYKK
ncbi:MAG: class I SAM-dependent methyltransferase [Bacteroidetes bacterium]|nr:class I SAM-dependent methyltransferase [Bacteroidota bacterium]